MPNPQFTRTWHGVPREQIAWHPRIVEDARTGGGTCVAGCSRLVHRFAFERKMDGGRFTDWAFAAIEVGDRLRARGLNSRRVHLDWFGV